jgi:hypothetical protein
VPLDRDGVVAIGDLPAVTASDAPHAPDHALEVELPFLQALLNDFALVPLLVGDAAPEQVADVLRLLWGGAETLIVISSDLSHYHDYDTARQLDAVTAAAIERGDWAAIGRQSLWLSSRGWSLVRGQSPRSLRASAPSRQFGRYGGIAQQRRWLWRVGVLRASASSRCLKSANSIAVCSAAALLFR